jgi:hypothetical protein
MGEHRIARRRRGDGRDEQAVAFELVERRPVADLGVPTRRDPVQDLTTSEAREGRRVDARPGERVRAENPEGRWGQRIHRRTMTGVAPGRHRP